MVGRVLLTGLLAAGLLAAQGKGGGKNSGGMDTGMMRPQQQTKMDQIADKLKFTKEQKEQALNIMNAAKETANPIAQQIMNGRQLIVQAMVQGQDNTDDFKKLMTQYTGVLAQMDNVETTAYSKIYALLKPNQQKNGEMVFAEMMPDIFMSRQGGGRGRKQQ